MVVRLIYSAVQRLEENEVDFWRPRHTTALRLNRAGCSTYTYPARTLHV